MATLNTKFKLNTGAEIRNYGTKSAVGAAIKKSGIPRSQIFITTKLWNNAHHPDDVESALDASLKDLGTDYVDLYLMHWPVAFARGDNPFPKDSNGKMINGDTDCVDTWKAMEKTFKSGKAKAIGISNFSRKETERLIKEFGNQNEIYTKGQNMGKLIEDPTLVEIGKKYNKSGAQGHSMLPKSKTPSRIKRNLEGDFKLEKEDLDKIKSLDKQMRFSDPSATFGTNFYIGEDGKVE
ncbi:MAG: hypothetical protein Q9207_007087 [Kuettlingeria erythrocarpa]